jgi:Tat protein secretion system quality control protein TatD with DNase activity
MDLDRFRDIVQLPGVVGIGEIPQDILGQQAAVQIALRNLQPRHMLVLHCRGRCGDDSDAVFHDMLGVLQAASVHGYQAIHFHCFTGGTETVELWTSVYRRTMFGVTRLARQFNECQKEGLRSISDDRLLVETDSPHLCGQGRLFGAPSLLGEVADAVARGVHGAGPVRHHGECPSPLRYGLACSAMSAVRSWCLETDTLVVR